MTIKVDARRVFLVDDHPVVLAGVKTMVEMAPDLHIVGVAADAETAMAGIGVLLPELAVIDVSLPGDSGIVLAERICSTYPKTLVLALTFYEEAAYVQKLLQAGARGFVLKRSAADTLIHAIRAVLDGGLYIDPAVASKLVRTPAGLPSTGEVLSEREMMVVKLVAKGYSNKEASAKLGVSVKTVETYRARAAEKLGLRTRAAFVTYATNEGWMGS